MKLVLAAPESFLPSGPTAFTSQVSVMHFFMNEVFAAPASGLPSLPTALLSQVSCATALPIANMATMAARKIRLIMGSLPVSQDSRPRHCDSGQQVDWISELCCDQVPKVDFPGKMPAIVATSARQDEQTARAGCAGMQATEWNSRRWYRRAEACGDSRNSRCLVP